MRVNDLLGCGYGFDIFAPSYGIRQRWVPPSPTVPNANTNYVFNPDTYGFIPLSTASEHQRDRESMLTQSRSLAKYDLDSVSTLKADEMKMICSKHNIESEFKEVAAFSKMVQEGYLLSHFGKKSGIKEEVEEMKHLVNENMIGKSQTGLEDWFD